MSTDSCPSSSCTDCVDSRSSLSGNSCCWSEDYSACYVSYSATSDCSQTKSDCPDYQALSSGGIAGIVIAVIFVIICLSIITRIMRRSARRQRMAVLANKSNVGAYQPARIQPISQPIAQPIVIQPTQPNVVYVQQPMQPQPVIIQQPQQPMVQPHPIQYQVVNAPVVQQQQSPIYQNANPVNPSQPQEFQEGGQQQPVTNY